MHALSKPIDHPLACTSLGTLAVRRLRSEPFPSPFQMTGKSSTPAGTWTLLRAPSKRRSSRPSSKALSFTPLPGHASPACVRILVARPPPADFPAFPPAARVSSLVVPRRRHAVVCGARLSPGSVHAPRHAASEAHGDGRRACERVSAALCVGDVHTHHVYARDEILQ